MKTPARILRATIRDVPGVKNVLSQREQARFDSAIAAGQRVFARHGRLCVTLQSLASALMLSPATLRRWFCDVDHLLAEILVRHFDAISERLAAIPANVPGRAAACRAAYLAATRTRDGALTEAHLLFMRDRHQLPPDEIGAVSTLRDRIGQQLAGAHGCIALGLLDMPELAGDQIEAMLDALALNALALDSLALNALAVDASAPGASLEAGAALRPGAAFTTAASRSGPAPGVPMLPQPVASAAASALAQLVATLPLRPTRPATINAQTAPDSFSVPAARPADPGGPDVLAKEWSPPSLYDRAVADLVR